MSHMFGEWKYPENVKPCELPEEVATAFCKAMEGFVGCEYVPALYVAEQVVKGINYCIICHTKTVTLEPIYGFKIVYINVFQDNVHIIKIEDVIG